MRKSLGFVALAIVVLMTISSVFIGCSNEIETPRTGSLTIGDGSRNARTISPAPEKILVDSYRVSGVHSDGTTTINPDPFEELPITIDSLKEGTWSITVEGLNADEQTVSTQTQDVVIVSGQNTSATFNLVLPVGTGTVSITVKWPSSVASFSKIKGMITPVVTDKEGFTVSTSTATLDGTDNTLNTITQTIAEFPTGSYQFKLEFTDDAGTVVGLPYREALNVYKGMTSSKTYTIPEVVFPIETPVISMDSSFNVSISCATPNVIVYYTTDGNDPTIASDEYEASFAITKNTTVKAIAVREDRLSSAVVESSLEVPAASPLADPGAGIYDAPQTVTLTSVTEGADIHYALDDSTLSSSSTKGSTISVSENTTIRAIAVHSEYANSAVAEYEYLIKAAAPTFSHQSNSYLGPQTITLSTSTEGAQIYYSLNESDPTDGGILYKNPIEIAANTIVKAVSKKANMEDSAIITMSYVILEKKVATPTFSPVEGTYSTDQTISITCTTPEASIYYTTDGDTPPTASGTKYTGPITIDKTTTVKAIAILPSDWVDSDVVSATYTLQVAAPEISLGSDEYQADQPVQLATTPADATIYYTLDNSDPKTSSNRIKYEGEFSIDRSLTLRAIAEKAGWLSSSESSETYVLYVAPPTFSVVADTYASAQSVEITSATPGATIYYTTNGDTPTSTPYTGAVNVNQSMTLKAVAVKDGYTGSSISSASYVIQGESGITVRDLPNYSVSIQLPDGWETGTVVTGSWGTVTASVTPTATDGTVTYAWYLDGTEMKNNTGTIASTTDTFNFGLAGQEVSLKSGPHILTVVLSSGSMEFSDQKIIIASTTGTVGPIDAYEVGDIGPSGGYVFYDDEIGYDLDSDGTIEEGEKNLLGDGKRYLEAAPSDLLLGDSDYFHIFGYYRTTSNGAPVLIGTATGIGTGQANTTALVAAMDRTAYISSTTSTTTTTVDYAARLCDIHEAGGYADWFLPSKGELDLMYRYLKKNYLGGFSVGYYWSSSEDGADYAWYQSFSSGTQFNGSRYGDYRVRPVRAF